jgi:hypothetical protein
MTLNVKSRLTKNLGIAIIGLLGFALLASCTPNQLAAFKAQPRDKQVAIIKAIQQHQSSNVNHQDRDKFSNAISNAGLARLRQCESGGNYRAVNPTGTYRGAYQFSRTTWNGVARTHYPRLNGVDPAAAAPADQDRMARALWATGGRRHWPHCGLKV